MHFQTSILSSLFIIVINAACLSQSTADFFSREGLQINAFHDNFFDGIYSTSYTFLERWQDNDGNDTLKFVRNTAGSYIYLRVVDSKVFYNDDILSYEYLLYDFNVEVGDTIHEGIYNNFVVSALESLTLLNGSKRKAVHVKIDNWETTYVEGIGDIYNGLVPFFADFEGSDSFVCAKLGDELLLQNTNIEDGDCELYSCVWPIPNFELQTSDFTITTSNTSSFGNVFLWDFGDGHTSNMESPIHTYENSGCYTVTLKASNDCYEGQVSKEFTASICINNAWEEDYMNDSLRLSIYSHNANTDFLYNEDYLFRVADGGDRWDQLDNTNINGDKHEITLLKMWDQNRGIARSGNSKVITVTADGGQTWSSQIEDNSPITYFLLQEDGKAYVIPSQISYYFYQSVDYGNTWELIDVDMDNSRQRIYRLLYASGIRSIQKCGKAYLVLIGIASAFLMTMDCLG